MLHLSRGRLIEGLTLLTIAVAAMRLVVLYPSGENSKQAGSWRDRDYPVWWWSHQLFHCEPEDLHDWQLEFVKDWYRSHVLIGKYQNSGLSSLSDEECRFVLKTIDEAHRLVEYPAGYDRIRAVFARRLESSSEDAS